MNVLCLCKKLCPDLISLTPTDKIGSGADGEVFNIAEDLNKVIKFSISWIDNKKELSNVLNYITQFNNIYSKVYEYKILGEFQEYNSKFYLYYYVMEKLSHITDDEYKVFHSILSHEDNNLSKSFSLIQIIEMLNGMSCGLDFNLNNVITFYTNLKSSKLIHNDIHPRNIMKDMNGNFKLIDFDRAVLENGLCQKNLK